MRTWCLALGLLTSVGFAVWTEVDLQRSEARLEMQIIGATVDAARRRIEVAEYEAFLSVRKWLALSNVVANDCTD